MVQLVESNRRAAAELSLRVLTYEGRLTRDEQADLHARAQFARPWIRTSLEVTGKDGAPLIPEDLKALSDEQLEKIATTLREVLGRA